MFKFVGARSKYIATFRDTDGDLFDGTVVLFKVRSPSVEYSYRYGVDANVTKISTGKYSCEVAWTAPGDWFVRWQVLSVEDDPATALSSYEKKVRVQSSAFDSPILPS